MRKRMHLYSGLFHVAGFYRILVGLITVRIINTKDTALCFKHERT